MTAIRVLALPALLALAFAGGLQADERIARGDRKFIEEAANSGLYEVHVAQLAAAKAADPRVKSFAATLVDDHTAANKELAKIANAHRIELPSAPRRSLRRDIDKLASRKSGAEFDREFVREIGVKAHVRDIKLFERASKAVRDAELKAFVVRTLPMLRGHLAAAMKLPQAGGEAAAGQAK